MQSLINILTKHEVFPDWRCGFLVDNILAAGSKIRNHHFEWIPRKANAVADWISRACLNRSCPSNWVDRPPPQMEILLAKDIGEEIHDAGG